MSLETNVSATTQQVKLHLTTRDRDLSLPEHTGPILVNTSMIRFLLRFSRVVCPANPVSPRFLDFRRYALSTLVNTLLQSPKPIPFEFLINGTFLRTSIEEYLSANGLSAESTLTAEYVRATIPPLHVASFQQDDWISSLDVLSTTSPAAQWAGSAYTPSPGQEKILSAGYDGLLRVCNLSSDVLTTSPQSHNGDFLSPIKAARFISPSRIASSGLDRTVRLWKYSEEEHKPSSATLTPSVVLYGHKASVDYLAAHAPSARLLSASADHTIGVWSTKKSDSPPAPISLLPTARVLAQNKRRKLNPGPSAQSSSIPTRGPLAMLKAHSAPASATIFAPHDPTVAYSTSWDHTLRTWDLPTGNAVDTRTTGHALLSMAALSTVNLLAAGSAARHIALIDPRVSATTVAAMTLRGHTNAVVDIAADPDSAYGLVSASHDGTCRVWDIRAGRSEKEGRVGSSVFVIERESAKDQDGSSGARAKKPGGEGRKVFAVRWDRAVGIVSGGEDRRIQINRGGGGGTALSAEDRFSSGGGGDAEASGSGG